MTFIAIGGNVIDREKVDSEYHSPETVAGSYGLDPSLGFLFPHERAYAQRRQEIDVLRLPVYRIKGVTNL